ncbi:LysR family transcriptional regulator [Endozoicomonas arenosclerae]|uniref:LysR family transcriptional regulator n=1 Tax=Endozoicomonas arenosclerae TaxID=1633495 RepID=UPI000784A6C0|nr:LysR family transcriptional regulator [Endozoicomonas arenosclerae]
MNQIDVSRVDLNLLSAFEALYEERSVSKAAQRMYVGQPAMSHSLARLRRLFDDTLLERQGQQMQPTRRASELYPVISRILSDIREQVLEQTAFDPVSWQGSVRIGLNDYSEMIYAAPVLEKIRSAAPEVSVSFVTVNQSNAHEWLKSGKLDLAVGHWPLPSDDFAVTPLYIEKHVCLFDNQVLGFDMPLSLEDYLSTDHALVSPDGQLSGKVDELLAERGLTRKVALGCTRFVSLLELLKGKPYISVVPEVLSRLDKTDSPLSKCIPPLSIPDFEIGLAWRESDSHHPVLKWLRELVATVVESERQKIRGEDDQASRVLD